MYLTMKVDDFYVLISNRIFSLLLSGDFQRPTSPCEAKLKVGRQISFLVLDLLLLA